MAAVLALTTAACGKGGSDKKEPDGGTQAAVSGDYVYSAQPVELQDKDGSLADFNMENLMYKDGRIYAAGYSYGFSDSGTHALVNFAPDGSDLQYSLLIGGGTQDVLAKQWKKDLRERWKKALREQRRKAPAEQWKKARAEQRRKAQGRRKAPEV